MKNRKPILLIFNCSMIITAIVAAIMFGILGYGRPHGPQDFSLFDFNVIYSAGRAWLSGLNPYNDVYFAYPPNAAFLFMLLSITDLQTAKILFIILNIFCIVVFAYLCIILYNLYNVSNNKKFFIYDLKSSLLISMVVGNVFIINILWIGQTSILFSTALLVSYYFYIRSFEIRSGIFLAFALNKPQLAYTFLLWLLLEKKWKTLAASIVTTVALGIVPIYNRGTITVINDWIKSLNNYVQVVNSEVFWNLIGLQPLLADFGIRINSLIIFTSSIVSVILIHQYYKDINKLILFGILTMVGLLLGQSHQYDLIIIFPILAHYLININKKDYTKKVLLCLTFIMLNFPRKVLFLSDYRILHHHRDLILIILLLFLFYGERSNETLVEIPLTPSSR